MLRSLLVSALAAVFAVSVSGSTEPAASTSTSFVNISPTNGRQMFTTLCTPCHGVDGRGHGSVVTDHKAPPIDLTVLSRKNKGVFPRARVVHVLEFGAEVPSHTSVEMPVWGPILGKINQKDPRDRELRINNLSAYLETIQDR